VRKGANGSSLIGGPWEDGPGIRQPSSRRAVRGKNLPVEGRKTCRRGDRTGNRQLVYRLTRNVGAQKN